MNNTKAEIYCSTTRESLVRIQRWLNIQPMTHLGALLTQAADWRRSRDTKQAAAGNVFYGQVIEAMRPEYDAIRSEQPSGIPNRD